MDTSDFSRGGGRGGGRSWGSNRGGGRGGGQGSSRGGFQGNYQSRNFRGGSSNRGRGRGFGGGRGGGGRGSSHHKEEFVKDVKNVARLGFKENGHKDTITAMVCDFDNNQLYTADKSGQVCVWDIATMKHVNTVPHEGVVDSLLLEGGYLFVGLHTPQKKGIIHSHNMATGQHDVLEGHEGEVYAMHVAKDVPMLFSGGADTFLYVWGFDPAAQKFAPQTRVGRDQNGHTSAIMCITSQGPSFLYTGDFTGNVKVWDLMSGSVTQTISGAHDHVLTQMMIYEQDYLLTCGLDGTIRVFQHVSPPQPGAVLQPAPIVVCPDSLQEGQDQGRSRSSKPNKANRLCQVLDMCGQQDASGNPVLVTSHSEEEICRFWDLPGFNSRGVVGKVVNARAICAGPDRLVFTGDEQGLLKWWQFQPPGQ